MNTKRFIALAGALAATFALPIGGSAKASEFLAAQSQGGAAHAKLVLRVEGLSNSDGQLLIGLYDAEDGYKTDQELIGKTVKVDDTAVEVVFDNLLVGRYAFKVFHDENSDGELNTNFMGIPSESYGFSNNASDPFSAPEWKETRFSLPRGRMTQTIDLS